MHDQHCGNCDHISEREEFKQSPKCPGLYYRIVWCQLVPGWRHESGKCPDWREKGDGPIDTVH